MKPPVFCSICTRNYLPRARVLQRSLQHHHPGARLVLLRAEDAADDEEETDTEGWEMLWAHQLLQQGGKPLPSTYGIKQRSSALKPTLLAHLLRASRRTVIFLDPDILITGDLRPLIRQIGKHALTLTPHILSGASRPGFSPMLHSFLMAGLFNAGFVGATPAAESLRFLDWWAERLSTHCLEAVKQGLHYDQRWLDHAPGFVGDLQVLRDPGCNVAYWNMGARHWSLRGDQYLVDGQPLRFFHFSGYRPEAPNEVTAFQPGVRVDQLGPLAALFHQYQAALLAAGQQVPGAPFTTHNPA